MVRHDDMNDVLRPPLRHVATHAVAVGRMRLHRDLPGLVALDAFLVVPVHARLTVLDIVRIVTGGAAKFPFAFEKTFRLAQPVHGIHDLELRFPPRPWSVIERELKSAQRLPCTVGKRPAIEAADSVRQREARGFQVTLHADFHPALLPQP